jgi:hypothetical protein
MNINTTINDVHEIDQIQQQQPMRPPATLHYTHKRNITVEQAKTHLQTDQFIQGKKVLLRSERKKRKSSSREALMIDMFANQNAILLKHMKGYEMKINELNNEKRLNDTDSNCNSNNKQKYAELEQQCKTLMKDSQKQSERTKRLSSQLVLLQYMNSKLEATLDQAGTSIIYIHERNQKRQLEIQKQNKQKNRLLLAAKNHVQQHDDEDDSLPKNNSKSLNCCQSKKMNFKQFHHQSQQQGTALNQSDVKHR